jgi:antitoxin YefM
MPDACFSTESASQPSHCGQATRVTMIPRQLWPLLLRANLMATYNASDARANSYRLIDDAASTHEPVLITGKRHNAVLISEEDWSAIQEILRLLSISNTGSCTRLLRTSAWSKSFVCGPITSRNLTRPSPDSSLHPVITRLASGEMDEDELAEWIRVNVSPLLD